MPRIIFSTPDDFKAWADRFANAGRYTAYITKNDEIVLEPLRSTAPLRYGYIACVTDQQCRTLIAFLREKGISVLHCRQYEWATDRMVGSSVKSYDENDDF